MNEYISRHPILDRRFDLHGYELRHAERQEHAESGLSALYELRKNELHELTLNTQAFLPMSWLSLKASAAAIFSPDEVVIELPPEIQPDEWLLEICSGLKQSGYRIVAEYSEYTPALRPLLALCEILKLDFKNSTLDTVRQFTGQPEFKHLTLLATGISSRMDFEKACGWGFSLFQGSFYMQPIIRREKNISPKRAQFILLMNQATQPELDFSRIAAIVRHDLALSYRLLRVVNDSVEGPLVEIQDIKHAIAYLGERRLRTWISMIGMVGFADAKPQELVVMSMLRARFCERIAMLCSQAHAEQYFLSGMFSLMDAILNLPLNEVLSQIPINAFTSKTLLESSGHGALALSLIRALETADYKAAHVCASALNLTEREISDAYIEALRWVTRVMEEDEQITADG